MIFQPPTIRKRLDEDVGLFLARTFRNRSEQYMNHEELVWLRDNNIKYSLQKDKRYGMFDELVIDNEEDALAFKLKFRL